MTFTLTSPVQTAANAVAITKINSDWERLVSLGKDHEKLKIKFVNLGREIGLSLQGLCAHKQLHLSFYENIKAQLPVTMDYAAVQKCIRISNALPEPITSIDEARDLEQLLFQAVGLEEEPKRNGVQRSHAEPPIVAITNAVASFEDEIESQIDESQSWDDGTKACVKERMAKHKVWLEEVEAKL